MLKILTMLLLMTYQEPFKEPCGVQNEIKTYMSYNAITSVNSKQWKFREENKHEFNVNELGIYEIDGYLGVAMGRNYGDVGDRLELKLSSEEVIKVIILDIKHEGCSSSDGSNIEFVVEPSLMPLKYKRSNYQQRFKGIMVGYRESVEVPAYVPAYVPQNIIIEEM